MKLIALILLLCPLAANAAPPNFPTLTDKAPFYSQNDANDAITDAYATWLVENLSLCNLRSLEWAEIAQELIISDLSGDSGQQIQTYIHLTKDRWKWSSPTKQQCHLLATNAEHPILIEGLDKMVKEQMLSHGQHPSS